MEKRNAAVLLLWLAAVLCWCSPEGAAEIAKDTLNSAATNNGIDGGAKHSQAQRFSSHNRHTLRDTEEDKALDAYAFCSEKAEPGIEMASNLSTDAEEIGKGSSSNSYGYSSNTINQVGDEKSEAFKRYEDAKSEVYETCAFAKDSMTEQAKEKYEHAKESASQATGDLGAKMRTRPDRDRED